MLTPEIPTPQAPKASDEGTAIGRLAGFIASPNTDSGTKAALKRIDPLAPLRPHQIAALSRALIFAGLTPEKWCSQKWARWALIARGMALAGHDGKGRLGNQLAAAHVSESRVTKLLVSRDETFIQLLPRVLRLMESRGVHPNWYTLSELVHKNDADGPLQGEAEALRLQIAGEFFSAIVRSK